MKKLITMLVIFTSLSCYSQCFCDSKPPEQIDYHNVTYIREDMIKPVVRINNVHHYHRDTIIQIETKVKTVVQTVVKMDTIIIDNTRPELTPELIDEQCKTANKAVFSTIESQTKFMIDFRAKTKTPYIEKTYYDGLGKAILVQKLDPHTKYVIASSIVN